MGYRIGIDVGGTFTDYLLLDERGGTRAHKVLSTPADPSQAVLQGLGELAAGAGLSLADFLRRVDIIVHGTTVTTNAVLTGGIARAGLITTHLHHRLPAHRVVQAVWAILIVGGATLVLRSL